MFISLFSNLENPFLIVPPYIIKNGLPNQVSEIGVYVKSILPIVSSSSHHNTGHVLVTSGDGDVRIMMLSTCNCLDGVRNDLSSL